ncbi:3'-5' exonuclease [Bradyrhizobium commune]|uniref:3'-5' exonuclease n=1 Tax=Bradyrhizobium commune TaxID=83627 RepID=UPI001AEE2567
MPIDLAKNNRNRISSKRVAVRLLSMHTAKGLEFPCVAISGLGLLGRHGETIEECVRLTYVGVTRATHEALLTYSSKSELVQRLIA